MQQSRKVVKDSLTPSSLCRQMTAAPSSPPAPAAPSNAGRWWLAAMGLFLALAGLVFTGVLWRAFSLAEVTRSWEATPCLIVASSMQSQRPSPNSNIAHRALIRYTYEYQGQRHTSTRIKRVDAATSHEHLARATVAAYPVGQQAVCYVNPQNPAEALLKPGSRGALYSIWFPLLFVVGGLGITWNAIRSRS